MYFEELKIGMKHELSKRKVLKEDMLDFAKKYDNIPLHTDEEYARKSPFHSLIAPGVYSFMIMWARYLEDDFFGEQLLAGKSTKIEWLAPVFEGDILSGEARVSALTDRSEKNGTVEVTIEVFNSDKVRVLTDVTEAIVKKRSYGASQQLKGK